MPMKRYQKIAATSLLAGSALCCMNAQASARISACPRAEVTSMPAAIAAGGPGQANATPEGRLIVVGFMGGRVSADNFIHREASLVSNLQQRFPSTIHAAIFANRDGRAALASVLHLLDRDGNGCPTPQEKRAARIVIFGHSWGGSETIALARRLNALNVPVLLTIQVDSVQKSNQDDRTIPANVQEAINFYQSEGLLHGRSRIRADDPKRTKILGNFSSSYRRNPVSCADYPWYARAFMKPHIEIENDPEVWDKIEALIVTKVTKD